MKISNPLFKRQVKRLLKDPKVIEQNKALFEVIDESYNQFDNEQQMLETTSSKMVEHLSQLNNTLKRLNASLDGFNYHVSHDLKTSFMNTIGLSKMLEKYVEKGDLETIQEISVRLRLNASNSLDTINEFLNISKLDHEMENEEKTICSLEGIISATIFKIDGISEEQTTIEFSGFKELYFNETSLRSVFLNLLSNSIKYQSPDRELKVNFKFYLYDGKPVFEYSDNGIGIDMQKEKDRIFQPFSRLSNSKGIEGSGIGLFMIKKIIESSGGQISLTSALDKGVKLTLKFSKDAIRQ